MTAARNCLTNDPSGRLPGILRRLANLLGPFLGLAAVIAFFAAAELVQSFWRSGQTPGEFLSSYHSTFCTIRNVQTVLVQTATVAVAALGMTMIIVAGGIDLSAGTALALVATVFACLLRAGWFVAPALLASLLVGCAAGWINGALVSLLRIVPFIITLGTMTFYLGLAKLIAGETTVRPGLDQIPAWIPALVTPRPNSAWLLVPPGIWLVVGLTIVMEGVLRYTVFGRQVVAVGSNEQSARLCGVRVGLVKTAVYTLAGLFVAVAGILQFARLSSGNPTSGIGQELRVIAAVVVGGGSLSGGRGSMFGTFAGACIMAVISSGCTMLELKNPVQDMVIGIVIVAAVILDQIRRKRFGP